MRESEEELKNLLIKVKEESEKASLKLNIQTTKIMAPGSIISWQIEEKKWKQWQIFFSWAPKSLCFKFHGDCNMKLKYICSFEEKQWQT